MWSVKFKGLRMQSPWGVYLVAIAEFVRGREAWFWAMFVGLLGRLIYHTRLVQGGHRRFWGRALWLELPIAAGMGVIGHGICVLIGIKGEATPAVIGIVSYVGPRALDAIFNAGLERFKTAPAPAPASTDDQSKG